MPKVEHWANIKENTSVNGLKVMIFVSQVGGGIVFRVFLFPVIGFYFLLHRRARHATLSYLKRINEFDSTLPMATWLNSFKMFWHFGVSIMDKFSVWTGKIGRDDVVIHNDSLINGLLVEKKGAVILTSHLGSFEICRALSQSNESQPGSKVKLNVLVHTKHADKFNRLMSDYGDYKDSSDPTQVNSDGAIELIQVTEITASTAIRLSEKVANGELIAIGADRVPVNSLAVIAQPFFGRVAPFSEGPFILASTLNVPILMLNCIKIQGQYHIFFHKLSDGIRGSRRSRTERRKKLVFDYAQRLQELVQLAPLQWFNFFDFWNAGESLTMSDSLQEHR